MSDLSQSVGYKGMVLEVVLKFLKYVLDQKRKNNLTPSQIRE